MKISMGKIRLENKVIDYNNFEVRPKIVDEDLEEYYDEFIEHSEEVRDYFHDTKAFDKVVADAAGEKRPKIIARERNFPFLWAFRSSFLPYDFLRPSKRRLNDKYFMHPVCMTHIPMKKRDSEGEEDNEEEEGSDENKKPLDWKLKDDLSEKFKQYPGYEGIIEIPNDDSFSKTKVSMFHEAFHYLNFRYLSETMRDPLVHLAENTERLSEKDRYGLRHVIYEHTTEIITDKLLAHDSDAQFECRWIRNLDDGFRTLVSTPSALATGALLGIGIFYNIYLFPLAFVPERLNDYVLKRRKESKREEILKPLEYPKFKI